MILEFDENMTSNLKPSAVAEWYLQHHTEQDLADIYETVHEMWVYHEDATYDYEEDTPEYEESIKVFEEWDALRQTLDDEIISAMKKRNVNVDYLDIKTLDTFMEWHGYENHGGWYIKKEELSEESTVTSKADHSRDE